MRKILLTLLIVLCATPSFVFAAGFFDKTITTNGITQKESTTKTSITGGGTSTIVTRTDQNGAQAGFVTKETTTTNSAGGAVSLVNERADKTGFVINRETWTVDPTTPSTAKTTYFNKQVSETFDPNKVVRSTRNTNIVEVDPATGAGSIKPYTSLGPVKSTISYTDETIDPTTGVVTYKNVKTYKDGAVIGDPQVTYKTADDKPTNGMLNSDGTPNDNIISQALGNQSPAAKTTSGTGGYQLLSPLYDPTGGDPIKEFATNDFPGYLQLMYRIGIGACFVLGVIMFTWAGIEYIVSESMGTKADAKNRINNALIGLGIALASYILLQTINPDLLSFKSLDVTQKP